MVTAAVATSVTTVVSTVMTTVVSAMSSGLIVVHGRTMMRVYVVNRLGVVHWLGVVHRHTMMRVDEVDRLGVHWLSIVYGLAMCWIAVRRIAVAAVTAVTAVVMGHMFFQIILIINNKLRIYS